MPAKRVPAAPAAGGARTIGLHTCMFQDIMSLDDLQAQLLNEGSMSWTRLSHAGAFLYQLLH